MDRKRIYIDEKFDLIGLTNSAWAGLTVNGLAT
jgi:hypothetical protein